MEVRDRRCHIKNLGKALGATNKPKEEGANQRCSVGSGESDDRRRMDIKVDDDANLIEEAAPSILIARRGRRRRR